MKKLSFPIGIMVCMTIFFSMFAPAWADSAASIDEKAEILNKLDILSGSDGNYNLEAKLKKCDAAAFIVKFLGAADEVESNKDLYSETEFLDVSPNAWYAPYIGYCLEKGIITNSLSGKYDPTNGISEMTFLTMALRALGYNYDDFSWSETYEFSYEKGLVTEDTYPSKTMDNTEYYREDAVEALFNALKAEKKSEGTFIEERIEAGDITEDEAIEAGLLEEEETMEIVDIASVNRNKLIVTFNMAPEDDLDDVDIKIYETDDEDKTLTVNDKSVSENELTLKVASQTPGKSYTVEISGLVDESGNEAEDLTAEFEGYRVSETSSDYFMINKVEPVSKNVVNLYFTHPVNHNAEIPTYYKISGGDGTEIKGSPLTLSVNLIPDGNNGVSIYAKNFSFQEDEEYDLEVSGSLCSAYGVKLNDGDGDSAEFTGKDGENDSTPFEILSVDPLSSTRIEVEFSREIDQNIGGKFLNYTIKSKDNEDIQVSGAFVQTLGDKKGRSVILTTLERLDKDEDYKLTVEYLPDSYRQEALESYTVTFPGEYPDKDDLDIIDAWSEEESSLYIYFDRNLDPEAAVNTSNYRIKGISKKSYAAKPEKAMYTEKDGKPVVKLFMSKSDRFKEDDKYEITISYMKDLAGIAYSKDLEYDFEGGEEADTAFDIEKAGIIGSDAIKVSFSSEIAEDISNIRVSNYNLVYSIGGTSVSKLPTSVLLYDPLTVILKFDELDMDTEYTLNITQLKTYAGTVVSGADGQLSAPVISAE